MPENPSDWSDTRPPTLPSAATAGPAASAPRPRPSVPVPVPPAMPTSDPYGAPPPPADPYAAGGFAGGGGYAGYAGVPRHAPPGYGQGLSYGRAYGHAAYPVYRERAQGLRGLGIAVVVLIGVHFLLSLGSIIAAVHEKHLIDQYFADPGSIDLAQARHADDVVSGLNVGSLVLYLAAGVVFIVWLWRARRNLEAWECGADAVGQAWAITAWLPLVNLVMPGVLMIGILRGSSDEVRPAHRATVVFWQLAYDAAIVLAVLRSSTNDHLDTIAQVQHAANVNIVYAVVVAISALPAIAVVLIVTRVQERQLAATGG